MDASQEKQFNAPQEQEAAPLEKPAEILASPENHTQTELAQPDGQQNYPAAAVEPEVKIRQKVERIAPLPKEEQLWQLKLIARDISLEKAIAIAKKLNDPWLEDKFHDDLMDDPELRAQLEAMGKLEKL